MINLHEGQRCFVTKDGYYRVCNFVVRNGSIIRSLKGWLKFYIGHHKTKKLATDQ